MFSVPSFPLVVNIWHNPHTPAADPPDVVTAGNLAWGRRVNVASTGGTTSPGLPLALMTLLLPALTDIRGDVEQLHNDLAEVPAGSNRIYIVCFVDDIGKGFPNEHRAALLQQWPWAVWPFPTP